MLWKLSDDQTCTRNAGLPQLVFSFTASLLILFLLPFSQAQAQNQVQAPSLLPPDVRLVIDVSGSMKRNDPNNLRQPAVDLLIQLLPENSKAGVWTFGKWVNMLVPHRDINSQWRELAGSSSSEINSVGLFTNIGEALEKAAYDSSSTQDNYRKSIILLTDGMVDIDKQPEVNQREWRRIVDEVLPKLKEAGFTIHTIALSDNADTNLLNKLSIDTDGITEVAHSAEDLMKIFLKAFDVAAPAEQVPLQDNSFVVDSSIEEFTALIFRKNPQETTELIGPDDSVSRARSAAEDVSWHSTDSYDLITVSRPLEGEWRVKADMAPESRITVVSNLNLRVKPLPNNVFKGNELLANFSLVEDGNIIKRREFLSLMDIEATMNAGNNENDLRQIWNRAVADGLPPLDGNYQTALPEFDKKGIYELNITVDGKSFVRSFKHRFTVRQPFGAEIKQEFTDGRMDYVLIVKSFDSNIELLKTKVTAAIQTPAENKKIIPMKLTEVDSWRGVFFPDREGEYRAQIHVEGINKNGEVFEVALDELAINYSADGGLVENEASFFEENEIQPEEEESVPEPEPEPKPEPETVAAPQQEQKPQSLPKWILYSALAAGNFILLLIGFFIYKKLTKSESDDDILNEFSEDAITEEQKDASAVDAEPAAEATEVEQQETNTADNGEPEEEEPPMEDLEPAMADMSALEDADASSPEEDDPLESALDDLDQMTADNSEESDEESADKDTEEDDDMVSAMLKAQGLDLADDKLDDAISSLIDDMDEDNKN